MPKSFLGAVMGLVTVGSFLPASASVLVTFGGTEVINEGTYSSQAAVTTVDFDNGAMPSNYGLSIPSGGAGIVSGSLFGIYLAPTGDTSPYLTTGTSSVTIDLSANPIGYFGLDWSSIDDYNTLSLTETNGTVDTYTGSQIASLDGLPADGSTTAYVNFFGTSGTAWNSVTMSSTLFAFESDNQAFGPAVAVMSPEPATWLLLLASLTLISLVGLRRKQLTNQRL